MVWCPPLSRPGAGCFDAAKLDTRPAQPALDMTKGTRFNADWGINYVPKRQQGSGVPRKVTCEQCFFKRNMLCALDLE